MACFPGYTSLDDMSRLDIPIHLWVRFWPITVLRTDCGWPYAGDDERPLFPPNAVIRGRLVKALSGEQFLVQGHERLNSHRWLSRNLANNGILTLEHAVLVVLCNFQQMLNEERL